MIILGLTAPISANTAACIIRDDELIAFVEEERFIGLKHAPKMTPRKSIDYCLSTAGVTIDEVDYIAIGFESPLKSGIKNFFENMREANYSRMVRESGAYVEYFMSMQRQIDFLSSLSAKSHIRSKLIYIDHHLSHAASAVRLSGYADAVLITLDGVGEDNAGMVGYFEEGRIHKLMSIPINH